VKSESQRMVRQWGDVGCLLERGFDSGLKREECMWVVAVCDEVERKREGKKLG